MVWHFCKTRTRLLLESLYYPGLHVYAILGILSMFTLLSSHMVRIYNGAGHPACNFTNACVRSMLPWWHTSQQLFLSEHQQRLHDKQQKLGDIDTYMS